MIPIAGYVLKGLLRHRLRSLLTIAGTATALFLFCFIEGLQKGVHDATEGEAARNTLIVYQRNRFCPATSFIPERYVSQIEKLPGVKSVLPIKLYVNNCRASLDTVTFRGVPPDAIVSGRRKLDIVSGDVASFAARGDAALVGHRLAARRGLDVGERFQVGGIPVTIAGVFESDVPGEDNVAYTQLEFLQRGRGVNSLGFVTQMEVLVDDPAKADGIARQIDEMFGHEQVATQTKTHMAFIASATGDLLSLVRFTRWLGLLCVLLVLALTMNTVYVAVQERVREHAVLQTLGFSGLLIFGMVVAESALLTLLGGIAGTLLAVAALHWGYFALSAEGINISFSLTPGVVVAGVTASLITGIAAGVVPALIAATTPTVEALRRA